MSVNVYILTYNRADYLGETIKSVLDQTYRNFSLYVLDNGSEDNTGEVVASFSDERLHCIRHERNMGSNYNFNFAIDHCRADDLVIFHDDDLMMPDFLETELRVMEEERADLVAGNAELFGAVTGRMKPGKDGAVTVYRGGAMFHRFMEEREYLVFPSLMYRKAFLEKHRIHGKTEPGPSSDTVMYFDIERCGGKICEIGRPVMKYRSHEHQDSNLNKYPMHVRLFHYLRTNGDYRDAFRAEERGRKNWYGNFSQSLFKDWMGERISGETADLYYRELAEELMISAPDRWETLYRSCRKHETVRKGMKGIRHVVKALRGR